jgi:tetratricopeptide (TPR) repeat protein
VLLVCLQALLTGPPASAQPQPTEAGEAAPAGEPFYQRAREAYRERDYRGALRQLVQAIQVEPTGARYYIGAARAAYYSEDWDRAVYFYDLYLEHFPEHAEAARRRDDRTRAVRRERDNANSNRATPDAPVAPDATQMAALQAFQQRLASGPAMAIDGTGAYGMYQTLLRTGYAHPGLAELRAQLAEAILTETDDRFVSTGRTPVPVGGYEDWQFIRARYQAVESLGRPVMAEPAVQAQLLTAQGQIDLLNANSQQAVERFGQAIQLDPELLPAYWGMLLALHRRSLETGTPVDESAWALYRQLEALVTARSDQHAEWLPLARIVLLADSGRTEEAAEAILALLVPDVEMGGAGPAPEVGSSPPVEMDDVSIPSPLGPPDDLEGEGPTLEEPTPAEPPEGGPPTEL